MAYQTWLASGDGTYLHLVSTGEAHAICGKLIDPCGRIYFSQKWATLHGYKICETCRYKRAERIQQAR